MAGFQPKSKRQNKNQRQTIPPQELAQGGLIQGAGTGTSDSIQATIPDGGYVMPADSTQQIGTDNLKAMGFQANVSNGEFLIPPKQVQAIGAQVLDQMKDATHKPVGGFHPQDGQLYFNDGGLNDEEMRRSQRSALPAPAQNPQPNANSGSAGAPLGNQQNVGGQNYTGVDQAKANAKADAMRWNEQHQANTNDYQNRADAHRAQQEAKFNAAAEQGVDLKNPQARTLGGAWDKTKVLARGASKGIAPALSVALDAKDMYDVSKAAYDGKADGFDVANQGAEIIGKGASAAAGAKAGVMAGSLLGAPGALIGGAAGGTIGYLGGDQLIRKGREFFGSDSRSPIEKLNGEDAGQDNADALRNVSAATATGGIGATLGAGAGFLADKARTFATRGRYQGDRFQKWGAGLGGSLGAGLGYASMDASNKNNNERSALTSQENNTQAPIGGNTAGVNVSTPQQDNGNQPLLNNVTKEVITNPDGSKTTSYSDGGIKGNSIGAGFTINGQKLSTDGKGEFKDRMTIVDPQFFNGPDDMPQGGFGFQAQQQQQQSQGPTFISIGQDQTQQNNIRAAKRMANDAAYTKGITSKQRDAMMANANLHLALNNNENNLTDKEQSRASAERIAGIQSEANNTNAQTNQEELAMRKQALQERKALIAAFEKETNPERKAMLQARLSALSGGGGQQQQKASDRYIRIGGGQQVDGQNVINRPDSMLDSQTGAIIQAPDASNFDPSMYTQIKDKNGRVQFFLKPEYQPK